MRVRKVRVAFKSGAGGRFSEQQTVTNQITGDTDVFVPEWNDGRYDSPCGRFSDLSLPTEI
jgi:hypothetical protein